LFPAQEFKNKKIGFAGRYLLQERAEVSAQIFNFFYQKVKIEGFLQKICKALIPELLRGIVSGVAGNGYDGNRGFTLIGQSPDFSGALKTVQSRHVDVHQNQDLI
jgi:hypothetical protein